jgi:hypothetical protein
LRRSVINDFVPTHKIEHRARGRQVVGLRGGGEVSDAMGGTHWGGVSVLAWKDAYASSAFKSLFNVGPTASVFGSDSYMTSHLSKRINRIHMVSL